eukprot:2374844-Pleurochrysis_carterae.AAC.1
MCLSSRSGTWRARESWPRLLWSPLPSAPGKGYVGTCSATCSSARAAPGAEGQCSSVRRALCRSCDVQHTATRLVLVTYQHADGEQMWTLLGEQSKRTNPSAAGNRQNDVCKGDEQ